MFVHAQVCGDRAQICTTQMQTWVSLWFMLDFVPYTLNFLFWLNWCLWSLLELLERTGFFNNCILSLVRWVDALRQSEKRCSCTPLQRDVPKKTKQTKDTNSQAIKSKRNQSLSTPRRLWVLKTEEDLPWGTWSVQLACLYPLLREQESKFKNTKSRKTVYEMNLEYRGTALELSFSLLLFFPNTKEKSRKYLN